MLFNYKAIDANGETKTGSIEAGTIETAISSLQKKGLVLSSIAPPVRPFWARLETVFSKRVSGKDIVILSRQIATLFQAQVSALQVFRLLAAESESLPLRDALTIITDDIQEGDPISKALSKHPAIFSEFYVNMVRSGEETGKLDETFGYLADHLDRSYEITAKVRNALIYPAFVVATFITVIVLMLTMVIPKISAILIESGGEVPLYTKIVLSVSGFFVNYIFFLGIALVVGLFFLIRFVRTPVGKVSLDKFKLQAPFFNALYRKLYLARVADNMQTMIASGIPLVRSIEITSAVVGNEIYRGLLLEAAESVRAGNSFSASLSKSEEIPKIMVQMIKVGEETGESATILKTLAKFYQREVVGVVDTLVDLIEPVMIVFLGGSVGLLLAAVLVPIYNIASSIS